MTNPRISARDVELYVTENFDGDHHALEAAVSADSSLAELLADEARLEVLLHAAGAAATFCPACDDVVTGPRCETCGVAIRPGGYTVERVLVGNTHGRMYVARDVDGKQVALKELAFVQSPSLEAIGRFEREVKILRALEHPAIPTFCASFEEGRGVHVRYYLAQDLVDGASLEAGLADHWYSEPEIIDLATQVLEVLVYLQALSPMVIHRDIKPANLLRRADGTLAVVDFGAAYVHGTTAGSTSIGTFGYMPVEQLAGLVDATTDVYALGATLLHLIMRQEPWRVLPLTPETVVDVSPSLRRFLARCVAPTPAERFQSAKEALAALHAREVPAPAEVIPIKRSKRRAAMVLLGIATAGAAAAGVTRHFVTSRGDGNEVTPEVHVELDSANEDSRAFEASMRANFEASRKQTVPDQPTYVHLELANAPIRVALERIAEHCKLNIVMRSESATSSSLAGAFDWPCSVALDRLLRGSQLDYAYWPSSKVVVIEPGHVVNRLRDDLRTGQRLFGALPRLARGVSGNWPAVPIRDMLTIAGADAVTTDVDPAIHDTISVIATNLGGDDLLRAVAAAVDAEYLYNAPKHKVSVFPARSAHTVPRSPAIEIDVANRALRESLEKISRQCGIGVVVDGDYGEVPISATYTGECDGVLEAVLRRTVLSYDFRAWDNLAVIAPKAQLEEASTRSPDLPPGPSASFAFARISLVDLFELTARNAGLHPVGPGKVAATVTIFGGGVDFKATMRGILTVADARASYDGTKRTLTLLPSVRTNTLPPGPAVKLDLDGADLARTIKLVATQCGYDAVVSGSVTGTPRGDSTKAAIPCDKLLVRLLDANQLDYRFHPATHLLEVDTKGAFSDVPMARPAVMPWTYLVDVDLVGAPVKDVVSTILASGRIKLTGLDANTHVVTLRAHQIRYEEVLEAVLRAEGLHYTYDKDTRTLHVTK